MRIALNGLTYHIAVSGDGPPLLLLHGFTGGAGAWWPVAQALARHYRLIAPDLVGHGATDAPRDPERYRMAPQVADLLALLDALDVPRATVYGYSLGGRVALSMAAAAPARVERLVLESASPGLADAAERRARAAADDALADTIERDGLEAFVERWATLPLFASQGALSQEARARQREQRMRHTPHGLANSLRGLGTGQMPPLWDTLPTLHTPALLIAGELDIKFCAIAREMTELLPSARLVIVPGAGHTVHLERPEAVVAALAPEA